jgi:PAS domain S-box-containing protein
MKTDECFGQWGPGGWKARDGRLWFATKKGAVMIDPNALRRNELPPPVLIEKVIADQEAVRALPILNLPPEKGNIEFHYTALSFLVPERVLFKYRLEGYDKEWVAAGTRRVAYYTGLPPGTYHFQVMACNNDGIWCPAPAAMEIDLAPHFYQTRWFYALCALVLALAIVAGVRLRVTSLKERGRQLESLVDARTDELQQQRALLQEQRSFLRTIIDLNPSFIFAKDREGRFTLANSALATAYGASPENLIGKTDADFNARRDEVEKFRGDDLQVMDTRTKKFIPEEEFTDTEGGQHWMQVIKIPIVGDGGVADQMLGVATDITERKHAEERLRGSLREKEVLLKEIHHRVKNNLQVVSSLLSLQAGQMKDEQSRQALGECKQRVRSMALIHENLYRSGDLANINFGDYLAAVTNELVRSFGRGIRTAFELEPILLSIDVAIPCGLIVNELVTNALKHGFPDGREGTVAVSLRKTGELSAEFAVRDDGVGIPPQVDLRSLKSMGMNLVLSLVDQIGGTVTTEREGGTTFRVAFPLKPHESH